MSNLLGVAERKASQIDGIQSGKGPDLMARPRVQHSVPVAALADQVRFALGQIEEQKIRNHFGHDFWHCDTKKNLISTHPILGETVAVHALTNTSRIETASAVVHTRHAQAPDVEYALILLPEAQSFRRELLDKIIGRAVQGGGRYVGAEGAAAVAVIPAETAFKLELEVANYDADLRCLVLAVRTAAERVDYAHATWSDLQLSCAGNAMPNAVPAWAKVNPLLADVFFDALELFDAAWCLKSSRRESWNAAADPGYLFKEYMTAAGDPWSGPNPHPLFDVAHYSHQVPHRDREQHPLVHYLTSGWKAGLSPHPVFDAAFYAEQADGHGRPALLHYLDEGWREGLTPHRLFCPEYFVKTARLTLPLCEAPLVTYLRGNHGGDPHYLFDGDHYRRFHGLTNWDAILSRYAALGKARALPDPTDLGGVDPLVHYIRNGAARKYSPHFLFDATWYLRQRERIPECGPPADDLLSDYLHIGVRYGLSPSRLVDVAHYRAQTDLKQGDDCLRHYLLGSNKHRFSPSPGLDARFYTRQAPQALGMKSPFHHLLATPSHQRKKTLAIFDPEFYLATYPDIAAGSICPIMHYLCFGMTENRRPNGFVSDLYAASHLIRQPEDLALPQLGYLRACVNRRTRVLFTSHEASRTGAPAIILSVIRSFAEHANAECFTILDSGGERLDDFKRHSHVLTLSNSVLKVGPDAESHDRDIEGLLHLLADNPPVVALVNSTECRHIAVRLARHGIPVISLVHETPGYYPAEEFDRIYRCSRRVVFPSHYVDDNARAACPYPDGLAVVRGQGLLSPGFGALDRDQARRKVLRELGFGADTALVIGCGSVDFRKGSDMFLGAASLIERPLKDKPGHRPVAFCWIGDGPDLPMLQHEIERRRLQHMVQFIGPRADVERYFVAADVFALTSRTDPYPCVVHEAMAAGLPVVGFDGGGGGPELFGTEAGVAVPLGDVGAMAEAIEALVFNDERRAGMAAAARRIVAEKGDNEAYCADLKRLAAEVSGRDLERDLGPRRVRSGRKVFLLAPDWGVSGVNSFAETLVRGLAGRGFTAEILFTRGRFTHWERDGRGRVQMPEAPWSLLAPQDNTAASVWEELQRFLREQAPCVVIPNYDYVASAISPTLSPRIGVVGVLHSDDAEHYEHAYRLGRYWNRIVAVSDQIEHRMLEFNPAMQGRLTRIPYGIAPLPELDVSAKFPAADEPITLVYTGRFEHYQKAIRRYVMLADQIAAGGVNARLVMCGDGGAFPATKKAMGGHVRAGRVELTGRVAPDRVRDILKTAHGFVLLSDFEGLPVSLLEAMDAGCVPIVFDMDSGIPEVVRSGDNGVVVAHGDIAGVVEAVAGLRADKAAWCRMATAARQTVRDLKLTEDDMAQSYAALLAEVFEELESGTYRRPPSLSHRAQIDGVLPPPALHDPTRMLTL